MPTRRIHASRVPGWTLALAAVVACSTARDESGAPPEPPLVRVEARDFSFAAPAQVRAGVTRVRLVNLGPAWHEAVLSRLPDGVTRDAYLAEAQAGNSYPVNAEDFGGPGKVATGDSSEVVLNLEPGNYVLVCWADAHVKVGMISPIVITVSDTAATVGQASAAPADSGWVAQAGIAGVTGEVRLEEFKIVHDSNVYRAGVNHILVRNTGQRPHDITYYRLDSGKTIRDFGVWLRSRQGAPPAVPVGGMLTLAPGREGLMTLNLSPGHYFSACGAPEKGADGKFTPHFMMGMVEQFEIK